MSSSAKEIGGFGVEVEGSMWDRGHTILEMHLYRRPIGRFTHPYV